MIPLLGTSLIYVKAKLQEMRSAKTSEIRFKPIDVCQFIKYAIFLKGLFEAVHDKSTPNTHRSRNLQLEVGCYISVHPIKNML